MAGKAVHVVMWDRVYVTVWYGLIGLMLAYEVYALLDGRDTTPPLTWVLVRETPAWVTLGFLAWLFIHLASRYAGRPML